MWFLTQENVYWIIQVLSILSSFDVIYLIDLLLKVYHVIHFAEATPVVHEETGPSEANLFSGTFIIDPNQAPAKEVKPIASLQKILRFRLLHEGDVQDATSEPVDI